MGSVGTTTNGEGSLQQTGISVNRMHRELKSHSPHAPSMAPVHGLNHPGAVSQGNVSFGRDSSTISPLATRML